VTFFGNAVAFPKDSHDPRILEEREKREGRKRKKKEKKQGLYGTKRCWR
jgi:hypothetical protein